MKKTNRLFSIIIALIMVVTMVGPIMASAQELKGSLTIHKLYFPDALPDGLAIGIGEVETPPTDSRPLEGAKFTIWKLATDDATMPTTTPTGPGTVMTTGTNGEAKFENLAYGRYYVEETELPKGVTHGSEPFMVDIPGTSVDGTRLIGDVHVYPKNVLILGAAQLTKFDENEQTGLVGAKFSLFKKVTGGTDELIEAGITTDANGQTPVMENLDVGDYYFQETTAPAGYLLDGRKVEFTITKHAYGDDGLIDENVVKVSLVNFAKPVDPVKAVDKSNADIGEEVTWTITATLPANITDYESYSITDVLDPKLNLVSAEIKLNGNILGATEYTVTEDPTGTYKIVFEPAELASGILTVTIKTKINKDADLGTPIPNKATINYNNSYTDGEEDTNEVTVETGGYNFVKVIKGTETGLEGAEFIVYKEVEGVKQYLIKNAEEEITWSPTISNASKFISPANGKFSVNGLAYGDYFLEEIKAPEGYSKLQSAIPFTVTAITHNADPQEIENKTRPKMPQTGGMGTILFTIVGLGLMGVAAKTYKKEER